MEAWWNVLRDSCLVCACLHFQSSLRCACPDGMKGVTHLINLLQCFDVLSVHSENHSV